MFLLPQMFENAAVALLLNVLVVLLVAFVAYIASRRVFEYHLKRALTSERRTGITFLRNAVKAAIAFGAALGVIYSIPPLRALAVGVFAGASILAAIIGFASQRAFSNVVSGIFIVVFRPFRIDDIIKIGGEIGTVEDITLRHTVIRALENKRIIYPNAVIDSQAIVNWTIRDERAQKFMFISIDFEADVDAAICIIQEEAAKHPDLLDQRSEEQKEAGGPLVEVPIIDLAGSMVNFRISLWARDLPTAMRMTWDLHRAIKRRFEQAKIALGRPSRVHYDAAELRSADFTLDAYKQDSSRNSGHG